MTSEEWQMTGGYCCYLFSDTVADVDVSLRYLKGFDYIVSHVHMCHRELSRSTAALPVPLSYLASDKLQPCLSTAQSISHCRLANYMLCVSHWYISQSLTISHVEYVFFFYFSFWNNRDRFDMLGWQLSCSSHTLGLFLSHVWQSDMFHVIPYNISRCIM